jgi:transcription antitermination factor NusG
MDERTTEAPASLPWFAVQVRTRHEIGIADYLGAKGYEQFLPLYKRRKVWSDRIKEVQAPLFPGYLFCRFDPHARLPILKTPGVVQVVGNGRSPIPVRDSEIAALQTLVASGLPNKPWPFLHTGDRVEIQAGPLRGLEGLLVAFKGSTHLVLSVTLLQRSVAVEIDSAFVTPVRPPSIRSDEAAPEVAALRAAS